jgi:hypothetical protein
MVLYIPLKLMPVVRWMTMVTDSAVMVPVLFSRTACSLYQGPLALIAGVMVTPPLPPPPPLIVRLIDVVRVRPPPVPVTVIVAGPVAAAVEAANVNTLLVPVVEAGLKLAVTPPGNPLAVNATPLVKPPERVIAIATVPLAPLLTVRLGGVAESVKFGVCDWFTVKLIVAVLVRPPPVPVTVIVAAPSVAVAEAANVNTLLVPVAEAGLNVAVTPLGNPLAVKPTEPVKPPLRVIVIALVPPAPRLIVKLDGAAESVKFGVGCGLPSAFSIAV